MRAVWRYPVVALVALGILGIPHPARAQNAARSSDEYNNFLELNAYAGYSDYKKIPAGLGTKIDGATILGARVTENFWNYVGIEEAFGYYSWNKFKFLSDPANGTRFPPFPIHILQPSLDVVLHFTPRDHKFRPFVEVGIGAAISVLGKNARDAATILPASAGFTGFNSDERFQGNYGGGIKYQANKWFGVRIDVRGYTGIAPRFGLLSGPPNIGTTYIPNGKILNGIEATGGFTIYLGHRGEAPPPPTPPPPPPPPPAPQALNPGTITASPMTVCPGDAVMLSSNASDPDGHQLNYQWTANGTQVGTGAQYTYMPSSSGDIRISLHIADATNSSRSVDASPVSIHVNTYERPSVAGVMANPMELERGQMSNLHATAMGSECSGTLTYSWAATEGTVTGTGPDAQFNSSSVSFNEGDRSRPQSKQVMVTASVTDSKGGSASASATITVNFPAEARHFGDILFPKNSARVNNCGKRVLIEQLYPQLTANPNYDVVLVGHIDSSEAPSGRSRRGRNLDRDRVLQTAAVLSGGSGTCSSLDTSRIKGSWIGATQETPSVPTSCAVSTAAPKERRGAAVEDTNEAKNRRVEIWLVPKGMTLPAAARDAKELPDADLKRIGCPK
jgi:outer membrane protein OmpA-like peptidoglycan-associated protein/outer membrane protein W